MIIGAEGASVNGRRGTVFSVLVAASLLLSTASLRAGGVAPGFMDGFLRGYKQAQEIRLAQERNRQIEQALAQQREALRLQQEQIERQREQADLLREAQHRDALQELRRQLEGYAVDPKWRRAAPEALETQLLTTLNGVYIELGLPALVRLPDPPRGFAPGAVQAVYAASLPAVVYVEARNSDGTAVASGTGFIVDAAGSILTCAHVAAPAAQGGTTMAGAIPAIVVTTSDGKEHSAREIYRDDANDFALLRYESPAECFLTLTSYETAVGEDVILLGFPLGASLGREVSVTRGIVSSVRDQGQVIQIDAAVNPGVSGGPVLNSFGEVIGIAFARVRGYDGLGFAVGTRCLPNVSEMYEKSPLWAAAFAAAMKAGDTSRMEVVAATVPSLLTEPRFPDRQYAIHVAAAEGSTEALRWLVQKEAGVEVRTVDGWTPLMFGSAVRNVGNCKFLLDAGADVNAATAEGTTALSIALTADTKSFIPRGFTPAELELARLLLEHGANTAIPDLSSRTPLMMAVLREGGEQLAVELVERTGDVEAEDAGGTTAVQLAAGFPRGLPVLRKLIDKGADVSHVNNHGETALYLAALAGNVGAVKALLAAGAHVDAQPASRNPFTRILAEDMPEYADCCTPLMAACSVGATGTALELLRAGAKTEPANSQGLTALHLAVVCGHMDVAKLLIARGARFGDPKTGGAKVALRLAKERGHAAVVAYIQNLSKPTARARKR